MRRSPLRVTTAFRTFASPALIGLSKRRRNSRSPADGAEREDRLTRLDVDEDLVPGGRSQRRATLAQRVRNAHQSHCVDGVGRERPVRGMGRVDPGERVACGVCVPASHSRRARPAGRRPGSGALRRAGAPRTRQAPLAATPFGSAGSRHGASRAPSTCCEPSASEASSRRTTSSGTRKGSTAPTEQIRETTGPPLSQSRASTSSIAPGERHLRRIDRMDRGGLPRVGSFIPTSWM